MTKPRVLIVDDEPAIRDNIQFVLEGEGFETHQVGVGGGVLALLAERTVDLVVLDVGLPDLNGFDLLKEIRTSHKTPVIMLTARHVELDRVLGLELGADDYVVKPFSPRELAARVKAVLRRTLATATTASGDTSAPQPSRAGSIVLHHAKRLATFFGEPLQLSKYEYEILATFVARPGQVFSREQLMRSVSDEPAASLERSVDAHIKNLRAKLRAVRADVEAIVTHRGSGYSLREDL